MPRPFTYEGNRGGGERLHDILEAIDAICSHVTSRSQLDDVLTAAAATHWIEIIGEAVNALERGPRCTFRCRMGRCRANAEPSHPRLFRCRRRPVVGHSRARHPYARIPDPSDSRDTPRVTGREPEGFSSKFPTPEVGNLLENGEGREPERGFEPLTYALRVRCSTN